MDRNKKKRVPVKDIKMKGFPHRNVDAWNGLDRCVVQAKSISEFKYKLDENRYGDETVQA